MKFRRNKILCTALLAGAIACGAMAAQTAFAVAEEPVDDTFAMMGASVRLNEPTGIRFGARLGVGAYVEPTDGADTGTSVSYGVAIFPVNLLEYCGIDYAEYNPNLDYVSAITVKGAKYFEYLEKQGETVVYETESVPVPVYAKDDVEKTEPLYYEVYGSIGDLLYNNLARDFFGIAYQKTTTSDGDGVTVSYRYASFENGINVRSAAYVASAAYADTSEEKQSVLDDFLNRAFLQQSGVSEGEAASADAPDWTAALSQSSLELYVGGGEKLSAQGVYKYVAQGVDKEVKIDLGASSWTSGNEAVASVDSTGAVKALKAGVAQITANVGGKTASCQVTVLERQSDAPYIVTVKGGTADKTNAAADDTVNLTMDKTAIPEGKQFSHWTMDGERIEGNSFDMPARDVTVEAVYVTIPEYSTIEKSEPSGGPTNFTGEISDDKKMFTLKVDPHDNQKYGETWANDVYIRYEGTQNTISFTLQNNSSSHDLNLRIVVQNQSSTSIALSEATGGTLENEVGQVKVDTIPQGESLRVSITASAEEFQSDKMVRIVLRPLAYEPHKYEGTIELSEILFGDAGSVQPEYSVKVNGGFADKTNAAAGDKVTLTVSERVIPEGKRFSHWTMNGETVVGNSFEMPAGDVTVTAVYVNDIGTTTVGPLYVVPGSEDYYSVDGNTVTIKTVCSSKEEYKSVAFGISNYDPIKAKYVRVTVTNHSGAKLGFMYKAVADDGDGYGVPDGSVESGKTDSWTGEALCGKTGSLTMVDIFFWGGTSEGTFTVTIEFSSTPFPTPTPTE